MKKKLPSVFINVQDELVDNNVKFYYSKNDSEGLIRKKDKLDKIKINKKIDELFSSTRFVYKLPVIITLEDEIIDTVIVYKNKDELVTMDNRIIKTDSIVDIEEKKA